MKSTARLRSPCKSILLVEDDQLIRETLAVCLRSEGYDVSEAANGSEGLERLRETRSTGLVLLDLMMPTMTGWEFLAAKATDSLIADIPVIVMSAVAGKSCLGAASTFQKPVDLSVLLAKVQLYCGSPSTG